jgi:cell division protein FtsB
MFPQTQHKILIKRLLGSKVFLFLVALALIWLTLGVGRESYRKYQLTKEINTLKSEIARLEGTNQQLANLIEYFQQESYLEKEARLKLNLKKPGEKVVVMSESSIPGQVEESNLQPTEEFQSPEFVQEEEKEESNWWKWWEYFFAP